MLMNSIIRKTLGLKYHRVVRVRKSMSEIEIKIDRIRRRLLACGQCGQRSRVRDRLRERRWRHVKNLWRFFSVTDYAKSLVSHKFPKSANWGETIGGGGLKRERRSLHSKRFRSSRSICCKDKLIVDMNLI